MNWRERIEAELELCSGSAKNENWYQVVEKITDVIDRYPEDSCKVAIDLVLKSWNHKPWNAISLSNENFNKLGRHKRAWYIQYAICGIYNVLAYSAKVRRFYIEDENNITEVPVGKIIKAEGEIIDERIYISRGGIINGDYIHFCYLKHQTGNYSIKEPIKIPVSSIEENNGPDFMLFVDHREPKLKALMEFYNVPIEHDDNIKYNVRTFKKLNHGNKF